MFERAAKIDALLLAIVGLGFLAALLLPGCTDHAWHFRYELDLTVEPR